MILHPCRKAGDENRTHVSSLEGWCSTIELHPHMIGVTGFEPATSWSQTRRSSQAEPHPGVLAEILSSHSAWIIILYSSLHVNNFFYFSYRFLQYLLLCRKIMPGTSVQTTPRRPPRSP